MPQTAPAEAQAAMDLRILRDRLDALEAEYERFRGSVRQWVQERVKAELRWRETHRASHEAMEDHLYALDAQIRRVQ